MPARSYFACAMGLVFMLPSRMYVPVQAYDKEHRYSQFLRFLVSSRGLGGKKVTKSVFVQKCGLEKSSARNVWEKGAFVGEYFR